MEITNVDKNGMFEFDSEDHIVFEVDGVRHIEWLTGDRCERTDSHLKINSDFSDDEILEIHDSLDADLESLD